MRGNGPLIGCIHLGKFAIQVNKFTARMLFVVVKVLQMQHAAVK